MITREVLNEMSEEADRVLKKLEPVFEADFEVDAPMLSDVMADVVTYFAWVRQSLLALVMEADNDPS